MFTDLIDMIVRRLRRTQPKHVGGEGTAEFNRAIVESIQVCRNLGVVVPQELIDAIAQQLNIHKDRKLGKEEQRFTAIVLSARDSGLSTNALARACGVSRPTIDKWKADSSFDEEVDFAKASPEWLFGDSVNEHIQRYGNHPK